MSVFPTNKTVPLDKDIGVKDSKVTGTTGPREQLSTVLTSFDTQIQQTMVDLTTETNRAEAAELAEQNARIAAINAEAAARTAADNVLQTNINNEAAARTAADADIQAQIEGERSLLRITASGTNTVVNIASAFSTRLDDHTNLAVPNGSLVAQFTGGTIDFATGIVTGGGSNFTPISFAGHGGQVSMYAMVLTPGIPNSLLILPSDQFAASVAAFTPSMYPAFRGGLPIGFVFVQDNGTGGVGTITNITQTQLIQFQAAGGQGGTGDTTDFLTRMEFWHDASPYEFLTPAVFEQDVNIHTQSSSVNFDYATNSYKLNIGQFWMSKQRLDDEFLSEARNVLQAEVSLTYNAGFIDPNPTVEITRDGINFQAMPVLRTSASSDSFRGELILLPEGVQQVVSTYALANADGILSMDATTHQRRAEPFTITSTQLVETVVAYVDKIGTPLGNIYFRLVKDDGTGKPSTNVSDIVVESNFVSIPSLASGVSVITQNIPPTVLPAGTYHLSFLTDAAYKTSYSIGINEIQLRSDSSAPTAPVSNFFDGTTWTPSVSGSAITYLLNGRALDLRVRITSSINNSQLAAVGVLYGAQQRAIKGLKNREVFRFDGGTNQNVFTLTTFIPDPDLLMVFESGTGQVYVPGDNSFSLDGRILTFPANTFNKPGELVTLIAAQPMGGSYDNSDRNAALLAANSLGSTDPQIDQSRIGRGIFLRRPDGTLREIAIDNNDNIVVYSV